MFCWSRCMLLRGLPCLAWREAAHAMEEKKEGGLRLRLALLARGSGLALGLLAQGWLLGFRVWGLGFKVFKVLRFTLHQVGLSEPRPSLDSFKNEFTVRESLTRQPFACMVLTSTPCFVVFHTLCHQYHYACIAPVACITELYMCNRQSSAHRIKNALLNSLVRQFVREELRAFVNSCWACAILRILRSRAFNFVDS